MLRNGMTGDWIGTFVGHKGAVWSAHLNRAATLVVTGSADYTAKVWDSLTCEELHTFTHSRIVKSVYFSKDGKLVLTAGQDKLLRIFDLGKPSAAAADAIATVEGHTQSVKVALWCNENTIISGGQDNVFRVWDTRTNAQVKSHAVKASITSMEVSLDNKHITVTAGKEVTFWDLSSFELVKSYTLPVELNSASLSLDSTSFVVGGSTDFWARVYDFATGKETEVLKGHHGPIHCVRFAPDSATFGSGSEDGTIRLWQHGDVKPYGLWQEAKDTKDANAQSVKSENEQLGKSP